ncbi:MAG TPA: SIS domain-containing protein [Steroidobacteraceae bacterium]|nr:SIS domain-containing protein [Steroidobacteraceae bacterium]
MNAREMTTRMHIEAGQAAQAVRDQLFSNSQEMERLGERLRLLAPRAVVTCARGSSDHAATFAKYLIETRLGVLTSSAAPSVSSVYDTRPDLTNSVCLAISQSGASPDLLTAVGKAREAGALVVALVNAEDSPLAQRADHVVPLCAGAETSVAATKSFIASLAAIIHLVSCWAEDRELSEEIRKAPRHLERAWTLDWSAAVEHLKPTSDLYVVGRGMGLGVAQEAALKLKETCGLHAEAVSAAELRHGPMALVRPGFPVLVFSQNDEARAGVELLAAELVARKADVMIAGSRCQGALQLASEPAHPVIEPMLIAQSFYRMANALSLARGLDPDRPPNLRKVTETV